MKVDGKSTDQKPNTPRSKHSATEQRRRSKINDRHVSYFCVQYLLLIIKKSMHNIILHTYLKFTFGNLIELEFQPIFYYSLSIQI